MVTFGLGAASFTGVLGFCFKQDLRCGVEGSTVFSLILTSAGAPRETQGNSGGGVGFEGELAGTFAADGAPRETQVCPTVALVASWLPSGLTLR